MSADLFGYEVSESDAQLPCVRVPLVLTAATPRGKHYTEPRGYAGIPGTGPADKQCRHCAHFTHSYTAKPHPKCGANRARWTHGRGSDILAKAPSCNKFQEPETEAE